MDKSKYNVIIECVWFHSISLDLFVHSFRAGNASKGKKRSINAQSFDVKVKVCVNHILQAFSIQQMELQFYFLGT